MADRRIRTKLMLLVALPVVLIVLLSGFTAVTSLAATAQTGVAQRLVDVGVAGGRLTGQLQRERAAAALLFAQFSAAPAVEAYRQQGEVTDQALADYTAAQAGLDTSDGPAAGLERLNEQLGALPLLREQVRGGRDATESLVVFRYGALISGLLGFGQTLSQVDVDADTADQLRAASTLSRGIEALGSLQVTVVPAISAGVLTPAGQQQVIAADAAFTDSQESFRQLAPAAWLSALTSLPGGRQVLTGERLHAVVARTDAGDRLDLGVGAPGWAAAMNARMQQLHQLEDRFLGEELAAVTAQRDRQRRNTVVLAVIVLVCLVAVAGIGWVVTRSMTAPLARLAGEATRVAAVRLPAMEAQLNQRGVSPAALDTAIQEASQPLPVPGGDEIGVVIAAFNNVLATAARVAAGQAEFREIVAKAFQTQAFEQQRRIDQITSSLDVQEQLEEDPARLQRLFVLDQQVTTLLRSVGTMQLFAGSRVGRARPEASRLTDVVSAAVSRVEQYQRVEHGRIDWEVMVDGDVVDELIHLLVELLTNALQYSDTSQPVEVTAKPKRNRLYLEIRDYGFGLGDEHQQQMQARIDTFVLDEFTARHYGLAAVGLIAARRNITVRLNSLAKDGTSVEIAVPAPLFRLEPVDLPPAGRSPAMRAPQQAPAIAAAMPAGAQPAPVAADVTQLLPSISAPVAAAAPDLQLDWQMPTAGQAPPPIYATVAEEHPLFAPDAAAGHHPGAATLEWQPPPPRERPALTASGLPVRVPGSTSPDPPAAPAVVVPQQRDPNVVRAQWSAFGASSAAAFVTSH